MGEATGKSPVKKAFAKYDIANKREDVIAISSNIHLQHALFAAPLSNVYEAIAIIYLAGILLRNIPAWLKFLATIQSSLRWQHPELPPTFRFEGMPERLVLYVILSRFLLNDGRALNRANGRFLILQCS